MATMLINYVVNKPNELESGYVNIFGKEHPHPNYLRTFGTVAYVAERNTKSKYESRSTKCIMVGYAEDQAPDCFTFFYMKTRKIIPSRGMIWTEGLNCKESDAEIQEIEDENETEDLVFRPYSTTKQSNEENLTRDMESGEATEEKIIPSIDQLQNLLAVNESLEVVTIPVTFERAVQESKWKDAMI